MRQKFGSINWRTGWNYFRLSPSLWKGVCPGYGWNYMGYTLRRLFRENPVNRLYDLLPSRFMNDLTEA
ncbi:MAG: hypothetical protein KBA26_12460, partial [Candidatus Delongbacteria bacterium]|nr:hypothetical protein [Candidatus Delongbacteria bacterium]